MDHAHRLPEGPLRRICVLVACILVGCSSAGETADPGHVEQPVMNGAFTADEISIGLDNPDRFGNWGSYDCSATLVRNDLLLTAAHCLGFGSIRPETVLVTQHRTVDAANDVYRTGVAGGWFQHEALDVALMQLNEPFGVNGSTVGHSVPLWGGLESDLDDHVTIAYEHHQRGVGLSDCASNDLQRGQDTHADFTNDRGDTAFMGYSREGNPQTIADNGDSGSAYRWSAPSFRAWEDMPILGINIYEDTTVGCPNTLWALKVTRFRPWAHAWLGGLYPWVDEQYGTDPTVDYTFTEPPNAAHGPSDWYWSGGSLKQASNVYSSNPYYPGTHAIDDRHVLSNARIRTRVWSDDNDGAGIIARWRDDCNYYRFSLDEQRRFARIVRMQGCIATLLEEKRYTVDWNRTPTLEFEVVGQNLIGRVDGSTVIDAIDDAATGWFTAGKAGFYSWGMGDAGTSTPDLGYVSFSYLKIEHINTVESP